MWHTWAEKPAPLHAKTVTVTLLNHRQLTVTVNLIGQLAKFYTLKRHPERKSQQMELSVACVFRQWETKQLPGV